MSATAVRVVISAFVCHVFILGIALSIGVFYLKFLEVFQQSSGVTSWIGSLNYGVLCAIGPIASISIQKWGCHITMLIGGIVSSVGLLISSFAPNVFVMFISFGVISGLGYGFVFIAAVVIVNLHVKRYRPVYVGISMSGVGMGTLVFPFVTRYFMDEYDWRGTLLIFSGLVLNVVVCACLVWQPEIERMEFENRERSKKEMLYEEEDGSKHNFTWIQSCQHIFKISMYYALHVNVFLFCFGQSVVFTHIAAFMEHKGLSANQSSSLIAAIGISNVVGRIVLGVVATNRQLNVVVVYSVSYAFAGAAVMSCIIWPHIYTVSLLMMLTFGFASGAFGPVLSEVAVQIVGVENFPVGYGMLLLSMGTGTLFGAPSAGWLFDWSGQYAYSFVLGGGAFMISSLAILIPRVISRGPMQKPEVILEENVIG